jgi:hypothetical protein
MKSGPHPAADLNDLWADEGCVWRIEHTGYGSDPGYWVLTLEWTNDGTNEHHADWVTLTWQFYGDTVDEVLADAVTWCWALNDWRTCRECDGRGEWQGVACGACDGTGLDPRSRT